MPLRLTLLGGAGGAGRTTWLKANLAAGPFVGAETVGPEGLARLRELAATPGLLKAVWVLDPLADPAEARRALGDDPALAGRVVVGEALTVIDAARGAAPLVEDRAARMQALGADGIILTKLDLCDDGGLRELIATLRLLNPKAVLFGAARGAETELPADGAVRPLIPPDLGEPCAGAVLAVEDWTAFALWLSALLHARGADVRRVRAWARTSAGVLLVHGAEGEMFAPEFSHEAAPGAGEAVILGRGFTADALARSLRDFVGA
jgi:hypothetical protein